jgi:hypothetical protein
MSTRTRQPHRRNHRAAHAPAPPPQPQGPGRASPTAPTTGPPARQPHRRNHRTAGAPAPPPQPQDRERASPTPATTEPRDAATLALRTRPRAGCILSRASIGASAHTTGRSAARPPALVGSKVRLRCGPTPFALTLPAAPFATAPRRPNQRRAGSQGKRGGACMWRASTPRWHAPCHAAGHRLVAVHQPRARPRASCASGGQQATSSTGPRCRSLSPLGRSPPARPPGAYPQPRPGAFLRSRLRPTLEPRARAGARAGQPGPPRPGRSAVARLRWA